MHDSKPSRRFLSGMRPRLVLGSIAAASLAGCSSQASDLPAEDAQFTTLAECTAAGFDEALCKGARSSAEQEHATAAPQFASQEACEAEWGQHKCETAPETAAAGAETAQQASSTGTGLFVPFMAGFVLSRMMQQSFNRDGRVPSYSAGGAGNGGGPVYRDRAGSTVAMSRQGGKTMLKPVNVNTATAARGGFGRNESSSSASFGG